jgi:alanine racemase
MTAGAGAVLEIDLGAIAANWHTLSARHHSFQGAIHASGDSASSDRAPGGAVAGVVKADAYGLGAKRVAPALLAAGCRHFFVAMLDEALAIRDLVPGAMLAVLGGPVPGTEREYLSGCITPVLNSLAEIAAWRAAARAAGRPLEAILHVDTGMSRLGLDAAELATLQQDHSLLDGVSLRYVMTHLVASEEPESAINAGQRRRFAAACAGLPPAPRSVANSSGVFLGPEFRSDLARPGAALYGINPLPGQPNPMRCAALLRARVLSVREIEPGEGVGYNATWRAARRTRIATAAIGYADGWHRALSGRGRAFFDGRPVALVGRVSMDLTTFDVTERPEIVPGKWLELIGPNQSPDEVAALAGTNGYEVLTSLGRRFQRMYHAG